MALLKNVGLTGSVAGGLFLLLFVPRGSGPNTTLQTGYKSTQTSTSNEKSGGSKSSIAGNKKWPAEGPWKASRQYFAGVQPEDYCPSLKADSEPKKVASLSSVDLTLQNSSDGQLIDIDEERGKLWCIPSDTPVAAMIATAPDPVHSHLSLGFDRTVEALQLSGEAMGYEMDQYWLPWQPKLPGNASTPQDAQDNSEKEKQPGLLMFRWNGPVGDSVPKVLYVFLVAETSTTGINGTQFRNAAQYVQQVCKKTTDNIVCPGDGNISVMGPTSSGSLASLRRLADYVSSHIAGSPHFEAFSGTVSSIGAIDNQGLPKPTPTPTASPVPAPNLTFRSMVGDSETAVNKFLGTLKANKAIQCGDGKQVAIFSEAATTYGSATTAVARATSGAKKIIDKSDPKNAAGRSKPEDECSYTDFRYPREISSLRNASASSEPPAVGSQQTSASDGPTYLPFTLADQQPNSSDEPPDFSQTQGPLSKEAVMMKYAADLRRGRYKYVGIIGSNVVDVLFIARFLRSACPDVRLFILDSDLLFERDGDDAPYIGMLYIGAYPLIGRNLDWTPPEQSKPADSSPPSQPRLPFPDQFEEGQYNASILAMRKALVSDAGILMEVDGPFTASSASFKPESSILPVWLTVVGTGGYWPVQIIPPQPPKGEQSSRPQMQQQDFSSAWWVITLLLTIVGFLQSWLVLTVKPDAVLFRDFSLINAAPAQRFFFINVISVSLALTLALFIAPALKYCCHDGAYVWGLAAFGLGAISLIFGSCCYLVPLFPSMRYLDPNSPERRNYRCSLFYSIILWMAVVIGIFMWCWLLNDGYGSTYYGFFFGYRSVNLASGVSPLTPILLLLIAIYLWGVFEIWRLRFDDQVRPRLNLTIEFPGGESEEKIACSVNKLLLNKNYLVAFVFIYLAWLVCLHPHEPFNLIEKSVFGRFYEVIFCIVVALMLSSGMRLSQTWVHLHHLLLELERSPICSAFSRLKGASWSSVWNPGGQQAEWTSLAQSFAALKLIKSEDKEQSLELDKEIQSALDTRMEIHALNSEKKKDFPTLESHFNTLQVSLAKILKTVMTILQQSKRPELLESDELDKADKSVVVHCCKEEPDLDLKKLQRMQEYAALRYVAFIRNTIGHIRLWLILQAAVFSLVLLSLNVYSFEPHRSLIWAFSAIFALIGTSAINVLMKIDRNHVISRITGTEPNKLEPGFYLRIITLGAVPLLTLLATHFPSIGNYLMSLLQPGMEALK
jgi:hypothetical protein